MNPPDFVAKLVYRTTDEGGRDRPLKSGCHPQVKFDLSDMQTSTSQFFRGKEWVHPGETVVADMYMVGKTYFAGMLAVGMRFEVREGEMVTAIGETLEVCASGLLDPGEEKTIEDNQALYALVEDLVAILDLGNLPDLAVDIRRALFAGATAGEVLGEIRLSLRRLRNREIYSRRLEVRRRVDQALGYVDAVLGPG
jgi:hypothetical protein